MRLLAILLLSTYSFFLTAQPGVYKHFNLVIAQSGLNIQEQPNLRARVVIKAPYLSEVEYLSDESFGRDTIGKLKSFFRRYDPIRGTEENDVPLAGDWVKVKHKGNTGYTFNAYLGPNQDQLKPSDYFVISPGENCGDQFFDLKQYHCYGVYGSGVETEIREIKASYVVQETGIGFLAPLLTTDENEGLKLVIGSKRALPTLTSDFMVDPFTSPWPQNSDFKAKDSCGMLKVTKKGPEEKTDLQQLSGSFHLGNQVQQIMEDYFVYNMSVIGCGDLDGDDKVDYLIRMSSEEYSRKMLYLSSMAKGEEILGLACQEGFGYCC